MVKKLDRLYSRATFLGFRRNNHTEYPNQALLRIEGVKQTDDAKYYLGKRVAYVYRAQKPVTKNGKPSKVRSIQGKIIATHGDNGVVRAKFKPNLPPEAMGKMVRVMLYPFRPEV